MTAPRIVLILALATVAPAVAPGADDRAHVPGHVFVGGAYVPDEPYREGLPRATGLQKPFPPMIGVEATPLTPERVELGRLLFFDPILSGDNSISCATCHHPDYGFSDGRATSMGFGGRGVGPEREGGAVLPRGAPTLWNAAYNRWQFWDGRAKDLEEQAQGPITTPSEMNEDPERLVEELLLISEYVVRFRGAFGGSPEEAVTFENVRRAIASFERTLLSFNSKFDRYAAGDFDALDESEVRGMRLFRSLRTRCFECHTFPNFADASFRVIGVPEDGEHDRGRASVPGQGPDGGFKVPTLRNVALTAPYMHNGAFATLEEVFDFYSRGAGRGEPNPVDGIDDKIGKFEITEAEKADLAAFLGALTDTSLLPEAPAEVPSGLPVVEVRSKATPAPARPVLAASNRGAPRFVPTGAPPRASSSGGLTAALPPRSPAPALGFGAPPGFRRAPPRGVTRRSVPARPMPPRSPAAVTATFRVWPGQSIQKAVDRARPGDRIEVMPGTYHQSVTVDRIGITLAGIDVHGERPILDGLNQLGDAVQASGDHFSIEGFIIRNYVGNGVVAHQATDVAFRDLILENTGKYGVYSVECTGVVIEGCTASGIADAAIYVGQSRDIVVRNNEVFNNVAGIEIENSVDALVTNNSAHHNTAGILVFVLPNNPSKVGSHTRVINNRVWANNHPNFAEPGTTVADVPAGLGILVMAADHTEVTRNTIWDNDSYGVAVMSLLLAGQPADYELDIEPNPDFTRVHANVYHGNGTNPAARVRLLGAPGGDLFWDGSGRGNAWRESADVVTHPPDLLSAQPAITAAGGLTNPKSPGGFR